MSETASASDASDWDGGWESHRDAEEQACLAATPAQRLAWLEEAIAFAAAADQQPGEAQL
ncbi:MAG: hypothetical protein ACR2HY_02885 [Acidimicrobiales bacterium]